MSFFLYELQCCCTPGELSPSDMCTFSSSQETREYEVSIWRRPLCVFQHGQIGSLLAFWMFHLHSSSLRRIPLNSWPPPTVSSFSTEHELSTDTHRGKPERLGHRIIFVALQQQWSSSSLYSFYLSLESLKTFTTTQHLRKQRGSMEELVPISAYTVYHILFLCYVHYTCPLVPLKNYV